MKELLILGILPNSKDKRSIGGGSTLTKSILDHLDQSRIEYSFFHLKKNFYKGSQLIANIVILPKLLWLIPKYRTLVIIAGRDFTFSLAPIIVWYASILKKHVIYHNYGGRLYQYYSKLPYLGQLFFKKTAQCCKVFVVETKELIERFNKQGFTNVLWVPNSRKRTEEPVNPTEKKIQNKYVFISRVTASKGIRELLEGFDQLGDGYQLKIFGPLDGIKEGEITRSNVEYCGLLNPKDVPFTLKDFDFLILPTYYPGEGYPGIIIESLMVGTPVISTYWRSIPEIITNRINGILVPIKNSKAIVEVISEIDDSEFQNLVKGAINSFNSFDSDKVYEKLIAEYKRT